MQGLVVWLRLGDPFVSQNPRKVCVSHSLGKILGCAYTICSYGQTLISCIIPSESLSPPSRILSYTFSVLIGCIRLLCKRSFRHYHHRTYICWGFFCVLSILWYDWSLRRCFVLLLEEIHFFSEGFPFLATSTFSRMRCHLILLLLLSLLLLLLWYYDMFILITTITMYVTSSATHRRTTKIILLHLTRIFFSIVGKFSWELSAN